MDKILILIVVIGLVVFGFKFASEKFSGPNEIEEMHAACLQLSQPITLDALKEVFGGVYPSGNKHMFRFNNTRYAVKYTDEIHGTIDLATNEVSELWCSDSERIW
ncbi:MAG: hypothetical protein AB7S78_08365 [Candidatus Omnitrophota bacterium]